jgi:xanthine dehydrogenase YagS FAD-binding subunit
MDAFDFVQPARLEEALKLLEGTGAVAHAGGVDLLDRIKERIDTPSRLVNLRKIPELSRRIEEHPADGLTIGAMTTLAELADSPLIREKYRALADAADHAATPNIRNMATIGGNLAQRPRCWYFRSADFDCRKKGGSVCFALEGENTFHALFDHQVCAATHASTPATALVAFDASVVIASAKGSRVVSIAELFVRPEVDVKRENILQPGELITAVKLPKLGAAAKSAYIKQGQRESYDWPIADVAVRLELDGARVKEARIVLGAAAPVPMRATAAEAAIAGKAIDPALARAAGEAAMRGAKPLAKNGYKVEVFRAVVARAILAAAGVVS